MRKGIAQAKRIVIKVAQYPYLCQWSVESATH